MKNMKYIYWSLALLLTTSLGSCTDAIYEKHQDVREVMVWAKDDIKTFEVDIPDTQAYDIIISLRHHASTQGPTILVQSVMSGPDMEASTKNVAVHIRDEDGALLGDVALHITDTEYPLIPNYTFPKAGMYTFKISHAEDGDQLAGLMEVGLKVVPVKKEGE